VTCILNQENDAPESAVAKLFASAKVSGTEFTQYGMPSHCLQSFPSEEQMRVRIKLTPVAIPPFILFCFIN
jgi:hypothetical protein